MAKEKPGKAPAARPETVGLRTKGRAEKATGDAKQAADKVKDAFKH